METAQEFGFQFDSLCKASRVKVDKPKKMCEYTNNFLSIEFDTLKMKASPSKAKPEKAIANIKEI